jgi:hypothetical protein
MKKQITFPPSWLAEARAVYDQYVNEHWEEEREVMVGTGYEPEPPQPWDDFLIEYHYAELENSVFIDFVNNHLACLDQ